MTISGKIASVSYGCKTPDGEHIYGDHGRCLICWQMKGSIDHASRVLMVVISGEHSDCAHLDRLAEMVEAQVRNVVGTMSLVQGESWPRGKPKLIEFQLVHGKGVALRTEHRGEVRGAPSGAVAATAPGR